MISSSGDALTNNGNPDRLYMTLYPGHCMSGVSFKVTSQQNKKTRTDLELFIFHQLEKQLDR